MSMRVIYDPAHGQPDVDTTQCHGHTTRSNRRCRRQVRHLAVVDDSDPTPFMAPLEVYCPWHRDSG
jgi:hypothetical protein